MPLLSQTCQASVWQTYGVWPDLGIIELLVTFPVSPLPTITIPGQHALVVQNMETYLKAQPRLSGTLHLENDMTLLAALMTQC